MKKIITVLLCVLFAFSFCACGNTDNTPGNDPNTPIETPGKPDPSKPDDETQGEPDPSKPDEIEVTTPKHEATTRFVNFTGSDTGLSAFLNDYAERHMRDTGNSIGGQKVGSGTRSGWREWDSMIGSWWDACNANGTMSMSGATNDAVNSWLKTMTVDNQGYVWCDSSSSYSSWGMGWAFPGVPQAGKAWEFTKESDINDWTLTNANEFASYGLANSNYYRVTTPTVGVDKIELTTTGNKVAVSTRYTPFLRIGIDFSPARGCGAVDDLYVQYKTDKDDTWDEKKMVSFSQFCTTGYDISANKNTISRQNYYFPMYLQSDWGNFYNNQTGTVSSKTIKDVRIILKAKPGQVLKGELNVDYVSTQFDDRQVINSANLIIALKNNVEYTRDAKLLADVLPRARKCMNFLLNQLNGRSGLISTEYLVGHFNNDARGRKETSSGMNIGNGYWDMFAFPTLNLYCNISFHDALVAMNYIENMAKALELPEYTKEVTTANAQMNGVDTYTVATAESLPALIENCRTRMQTEFWNEATGRFHAGKRDGKANGSIQDHGYVVFNQQMITSGIATEEQAKSIMAWINGERIVSGDNSTGKDIYKYEFAPRINTQHIGTDFYWPYSVAFNGNVQNGGAAIHCAYYDVVAESKLNAETGFKKLKNIQAWYEKVKAAGGEGWNFYRAYYNGTGIKLQGGQDANGKDINGVLGVDYEFLEAALLVRCVPDSFFGMSTLPDGTLCYTPQVSKEVEWLGMENLVFGGYYYDVAISENYVQLHNVAEYSEGSAVENTHLQVSLKVPATGYKVYVNGKSTTDYTVIGGRIVVKVPFGNARVEVK